MAQIVLTDLDDNLVERLKSQASRHGRSLEREVQLILEQQSAALSPTEARVLVDGWSKRLEGRKFSDSTELLREDRER